MTARIVIVGLLALVAVGACGPIAANGSPSPVSPASSIGLSAAPSSSVTSSATPSSAGPSPSPSDAPIASPPAPSAPPPSATTAPSPSAGTFADGIPSVIDGQPVYRPNDALTAMHDATPILIGGWTQFLGAECPSPSAPPGTAEQLAVMAILAPGCPIGPTLGESLDEVGLWGAIRNPSGLQLPNPGAVVVRAHMHDPRAANCPPDRVPDCDNAVVLDAVVWSRDGVPPTPTLGPVAATMSVGEFVAARDAGTLPDGQILLHGYWSNRATGHSCVPPDGPAGDLEIYCHDGEWGITERDEPIVTYVRTGLSGIGGSRASGPVMTPYLSEPLMERLTYFSQQRQFNGADGRWPLPVPIVVVGHVRDPRAAECRPSARQVCEDRFVVDRIVEFDPSSVPTPSPTPPPTPFPSPPPAPLFTKAQCHGDVPYSFIGWAPLKSLGIGDERPDHVYAMVTRDTIPLGEWVADPARKGHRFRVWGRGVCWTGDAGVILFDEVKGTAYRLYDDGTRVPGI